ncbi:DNA starvation/stationary phase protection protein Dps [Haloarchaeobius sp. HRN-SO-5]|uniref:DNA starvation/stationary phase protection protein Dps n=1 Tax=Haloarchaeobius sp. HRN-SO-5 TaxID=3446118 RepID=UPI003EB74832
MSQVPHQEYGQQTGGQTQHGQQFPQGQVAGSQQSMGRRQVQSLLYPTRNFLPESVRVPMIQQLNRTLADTTVLLTHVRYAHWNVKGMEFVGLHELFEDIAEHLAEQADLIAERVTALGGQAMGTAGMAVSNCRMPQMPSAAVTGREYVELLVDRLAIYDARLHEDITVANQYDDFDTADLLNEISRTVSQDLWFLEAHLQTEPQSSVPISGETPEQQAAPQQGQEYGQQYPAQQFGQQAQVGQQPTYGGPPGPGGGQPSR